MNPDSSAGRVMTSAEAEAYFEQVIAAEKAMGPLTREEKMVILQKFGSDVSLEDLIDLLRGKRVLQVGFKPHNSWDEHHCPECGQKGDIK